MSFEGREMWQSANLYAKNTADLNALTLVLKYFPKVSALFAEKRRRILSSLYPQGEIQNMESNTDRIFVYGILKRGFGLDLSKRHGTYLGNGAIEGATLRPIGEGVGLRFDQDPGYLAFGEVFEIPTHLWPWLDAIESNGKHYTRRETDVNLFDKDRNVLVIKAWVYEHTYPGMAYADPIKSGCYGEMPVEGSHDDAIIAKWPIEEFELGGEG